MTWPDLIKLVFVDNMADPSVIWAMLASLVLCALVVLCIGIVWALRPAIVRGIELRHQAPQRSKRTRHKPPAAVGK